MTIFLPESVRQEVWNYVFAEADELHYLDAGRSEHIQFIEALGRDPHVGGRLQEFMRPDKVAGYIRHSILNQYAKERRAVPRDIDNVLATAYGVSSAEIEYDPDVKLSLHRLANGDYVAASRTHVSSWPNGLKRLLLYVAAAPGLWGQEGKQVSLALLIYQHGVPPNGADRQLIEKGLQLINVHCIWQ